LLEDLDIIPWTQLEHAYGSAGDVPIAIRELLSPDKAIRGNAQYMLYAGPFHQGTTTSCLPFVVRFLIELLSYEITPDRDWIVRYLANAARVCDACMEIDYSAIPESARKYIFAKNDEQYELESHLRQELTNGFSLFLHLLNTGSADILATIPALLARLRCQDAELRKTLNTKLQYETRNKVRAIFAFCLGILCNPDSLHEKYTLDHILESTGHDITVRLAAGFGLINGFRRNNSNERLQRLANLIMNFPAEVIILDQWHGIEMTELAKVWPATRLLEALYLLEKDQQQIFVPSIEILCQYTRGNSGFGLGHYQGILKQLKSS
jgi:hypothetical protein